MENNLPNTSTPQPAPIVTPTPIMPDVATPPIPPVDPTPQYSPPVQQMPQAQNSGNKNFVGIAAILGVVLLVVAIGTLYVLSLKKTTSTAAINYDNSTTQTPTLTPTPTISSPQSDAAAVQEIDAGDPTGDLQSINIDFNQL